MPQSISSRRTRATILATALLTAAMATVCTKVVSAAEPAHREAGAHAHGHGRANIAVEGSKLLIEIEVPADDAVGFEHEPRSDRQKSQVAAAKALLTRPLDILDLPRAADCRVVKATSAHKIDGSHAEFQAAWELECNTIAKLTTIGFKYFKLFSRAKELEVAFIGPRGQKSFEVVRKKPSISTAGLI